MGREGERAILGRSGCLSLILINVICTGTIKSLNPYQMHVIIGCGPYSGQVLSFFMGMGSPFLLVFVFPFSCYPFPSQLEIRRVPSSLEQNWSLYLLALTDSACHPIMFISPLFLYPTFLSLSIWGRSQDFCQWDQ